LVISTVLLSFNLSLLVDVHPVRYFDLIFTDD
jgi:hypothetical protein